MVRIVLLVCCMNWHVMACFSDGYFRIVPDMGFLAASQTNSLSQLDFSLSSRLKKTFCPLLEKKHLTVKHAKTCSMLTEKKEILSSE